jgi:hypothetical protein
LDFRGNGKVIVRDLSSSVIDETEYTVERGVVVIKVFKFFGVNGSLELSMDGDALVAADGRRYTKDTSGRTYTPAERVQEAARAQAEAAKARSEAAKARSEADKIKAEAEAKLRMAEMTAQAEAEAARAKIEAEKTEAIKRANAAKAAALAHLPSFTNQIVTITNLGGAVYTNIALVRASPDGIVYRTTDGAGGGCISYTNLSPDVLETFGIDTNCISIAQERAELKAAADAYDRAISAQKGAATAAGAPAAPPAAENPAFQKRYGKKR